MDYSNIQELPLISIAATAIVILLTIFYYFIKHRGVLPGPTGVPYLGLLPFLKDETAHLQLTEYGKKYGDIFSFTYSGELFIHMGSIKVMKDLHITKSEFFAARFTSFCALTYMLSDGLAMSNGDAWKTLRKFFLQKLREYGLNSLRDALAGPIYDSLETTITTLKKAQDKPINIVQLLTERCTVTLRRMIFGDNGITDEELQAINAGYAESLEGMTGGSMLLMGPFARFLYSISPAARKTLGKFDMVREIFNTCVKRMELSMNDDTPTCIIEEYYKERNEKRKQNDPVWKIYTDKALVSSLAQFVGDGIASVASFIAGILNALIQHPDEQEKVYEEIMEVIGPSRQLSLDDKAKLPYLNAFMNEVIRTSTSIPLFPSLECTKETTYRGYRIPKGAITLQNFWAIHHNTETFDDPDKFNPSRYIATPEKPRAELPVSFGMGKRACTGEAFVMAETFLFVSTIIQNFKIISSNDPKNMTADFLLSGKLELRFQPRMEK